VTHECPAVCKENVACEGYKLNSQKGIRWMRVCHGVTATFDDPNLVSCAGLAPVLDLAGRAGLQDLVSKHVRIDKPGGGNAVLKVPALVAGMIAGAASIEDMGLLRHRSAAFFRNSSNPTLRVGLFLAASAIAASTSVLDSSLSSCACSWAWVNSFSAGSSAITL